jgi:hypothetical protein
MKVRMSGRAWRGLTFVSVMALVLLGALSCGPKELQVKGLAKGKRDVQFLQCATDDTGNQRLITITPGDSTVNPPTPPTVTVDACTISPKEKITWVCIAPSGCKGWTVTFDDRNVDDTQLFEGNRVKFGDTASNGTTTDSGTLVKSDLLKNGAIIVKYTVQTVGSPPYDPHIVPMDPSTP